MSAIHSSPSSNSSRSTLSTEMGNFNFASTANMQYCTERARVLYNP